MIASKLFSLDLKILCVDYSMIMRVHTDFDLTHSLDLKIVFKAELCVPSLIKRIRQGAPEQLTVPLLWTHWPLYSDFPRGIFPVKRPHLLKTLKMEQ